MRLIGASRSYVQMPFVLEGAFYGFMGAFLGFIFSMGLVMYQAQFFSGLLVGITTLQSNLLPLVQVWPISAPFVLIIFAVAAAFGVLLGTLGSLIAVQRYLE